MIPTLLLAHCKTPPKEKVARDREPPASFSWSHLYRLQDVIGTNLLDDDISMSSPDHIDLLVRAFNAAWEYYFQPGRNGGVLECLARPALAEFLVGKLREGIDDEPSLAAAGLEFLFSLEDTQDEPIDVDFPSWGLHLENAVARFVPVGHVRLTF